jgi:hypothetical protein
MTTAPGFYSDFDLNQLAEAGVPAGLARAMELFLRGAKSADLAAPSFRIIVEGNQLPIEISSLVESVVFEHIVSGAGKIEIKILNPHHTVTDPVSADKWEFAEVAEALKTPGRDMASTTMFQPGSSIDLEVVYGSADPIPMGRFILMRHVPAFSGPGGEVPVLSVVGYTFEQLMGGLQGQAAQLVKGNQNWRIEEAAPDRANKPQKLLTGKKRSTLSKNKQGRVWYGARASETKIAAEICKEYGISIDIGEKKGTSATESAGGLFEDVGVGEIVPIKGRGIHQPKGQSDYKVLSHLAMATARKIWCEYDYWGDKTSDGQPGWVLNFRRTRQHDAISRPLFTFDYSSDGGGTLLEFFPEFGIEEQATDFSVQVTDRKTGRQFGLFEGWRDRVGSIHVKLKAGLAGGETTYTTPPPPALRKRKTPKQRTGRAEKAVLDATNRETLPGGAAGEVKKRDPSLSDADRHRFRLASHTRRAIRESWMAANFGRFSPEVFTVKCGKFSFSFRKRDGYRNEIELARDIQRLLLNMRERFATFQAKVIGNPFLRGDQIVQFDGLGVWSGMYFVRLARHQMEKGQVYVVHLEGSRVFPEIDLVPLNEDKITTVKGKIFGRDLANAGILRRRRLLERHTQR